MATWSISPTDATINSSGVASFPSNTTSVDKLYTVTYTDDNGCTGVTTYTVPACPPPPPTPTDCTTYRFSNLSSTTDGSGTAVRVASSLKSKGQLTFSSSSSSSWISFVRTDSDSSYYYYVCSATNYSGYRSGTIKFTSSDGCEFTATMKQEGKTCQCSDIESGIVYESTYLPTSARKDLLLFSADTQGCGSISAYCSSSEDSIFESDGDNLVKVVEVEANRKYEVRANVLRLPSGSPGRSCVVNIHVKRADGTLCKTIAKDFIQDPNINCSSGYGYQATTAHTRTESGEVLIARSIAYNYNSQIIDILKLAPSFTPPTWISDDSNFKYVLGSDNRWEVYANIYPNIYAADRETYYKTTRYILDTPATVGTRYTPAQLKSMSTTNCGEKDKVTVTQYGCNCNVPIVYGGTTMKAEEGEYNGSVYYYGADVDTSCTRLTGATKKDSSCTWVSDLSVSDNENLHFRVSKNNVAEERRCTIVLHFTDANRDNCEKDYTIKQEAGEIQINCASCNSITEDGIIYVYSTIYDNTKTNMCLLEYYRKIEEDCDGGEVTFTSSTSGIENPITGFRLDRIVRSGIIGYCYFNLDANTSEVDRQIKLKFNYRNNTISNCSKEYLITQKAYVPPTPGSKCNAQTYNYNFVYITGDKGKTLNNPVVFSAGERLKIGSLSNSIPSSATSCCGIEAITTQTDVFGNVTVTPKSGGGYDIYATALTGVAAQDATIDVSWWYEDSSGRRYYPNTTNVYVRNKG